MNAEDRAFLDYFNPGTTLDENTVLTDYWLDFVAVREEVEEPQLRNRIATEELYEKVQDFGQRIEALLDDQRRIRSQFDRFVPNERSSGGELRTTPQVARQENHESGQNHHRSLAERLRSSFIYTAIQKLR